MKGRRLSDVLGCSALHAIARRLWPQGGRGGRFDAERSLPSSSRPPHRRSGMRFCVLAEHDTYQWVCMSCQHGAVDGATPSSLLKARVRRMCRRSHPLLSKFARVAGTCLGSLAPRRMISTLVRPPIDCNSIDTNSNTK